MLCPLIVHCECSLEYWKFNAFNVEFYEQIQVPMPISADQLLSQSIFKNLYLVLHFFVRSITLGSNRNITFCERHGMMIYKLKIQLPLFLHP